jgi:mycothiol synthase
MSSIRNYSKPDLEKLRDLYTRTGQNSLWGVAVGGRQIELLLQRPQYSPSADMFVVENREQGTLVGYGDVMREVRIGRVVLDVFVEPEFRGRGWGGRLVERICGRALGLGAQLVHACVDEGNREGAEFLQHKGFSRVRQHLVFERPEGDYPEGQVDFGDYTVSRFSAGDEQALADIQNEVFEGSWGYCPNTAEEIGFFLALTLTRLTEVLALRDKSGEVVGYLWPQVLSRSEAEGGTHGWVHMVGIRADLRGRSLGRKLMEAGLRVFAEQGVRDVELTVDEVNRPAVELYRKLGFRTKARKLWFERVVA